MNTNNDNISIKDNNSQIISILPNDLIEPLIIIARIKGYNGIDDYVIQLVKDDLVSIRDGGQGVTDIGECIAKYLEKNEYLEKVCPGPNPYDKDDDKDEEDEESEKEPGKENVSDFVKKVNSEYYDSLKK